MRFRSFSAPALLLALVLSGLSLLSSCDGGSTEPTVGTVQLSLSTLSVTVQETGTVTASVKTSGGATLADRAVTWSSSNANGALGDGTNTDRLTPTPMVFESAASTPGGV